MSAAQNLTPSMLASLRGARDLANPYAGCLSRSDYGARTGTVTALRRRGLLSKDGSITEAGRVALSAKVNHE